MATGQTITELTELTSVASSDVVAIVDDPSGTPITKKITVDNLTALTARLSESNTFTNDNAIILPLSNDALTPTLSFGDGDSGFYERTDDEIDISISGVSSYRFTSNYFSSTVTGGGAILQSGTTETIPALTLTLDLDTGIGSGESNQMSLIAGGVQAVNLTTTLVDVKLQMGLNDNQILQAELADFSIQNDNQGIVADASQTLTYSDGPVHELDVANWSTNRTLTISGGPPSTAYGSLIVKVIQHGITARTITWAGGTFVWPGGTEHPLTTTLDGTTVYTFETWDGGNIWHGSGVDYAAGSG